MRYSISNFEKCNEIEHTKKDLSKVIFHIDVNSAYLSWMAAYRIQQGSLIDLRDIPSVVGGDELSRHGIVLAKSISAKQYGIKTGNPLRTALEQCPELTIVPPDYYLFQKASKAMMTLLDDYSPDIQQFSVDECFMDFTKMQTLLGEPLEVAHQIRKRIKKELGFTVNIGISTNKILAKMGSELEKPDRVHTLYPKEMGDKMWPLPVGDLFMVGKKTEEKLRQLGINTIGELAHMNLRTLQSHFKSFGLMIYQYANGIDSSVVRSGKTTLVKGVGNSTTVPFDVIHLDEADKVILSLCESVAMRLRGGEYCTGVLAVHIVTKDFVASSHQRKLDVATDSTSYMYRIAKELFVELWDGTPIRKLGIRASELQDNGYYQHNLFESFDFEKQKDLDKCVDQLRDKYGKNTIIRASFLHSGIKPINGGIGEEGYPTMTSIL